MNGYQRFMAALRREQPDRVPLWELIINRPVIEALHGDVSYLDFCELEDLDGVCIFDNNRNVELDASGAITRSKIVDPSWFNWPALPVAMANTIVPDFPLTNKSFNQSYAGNDL